MKRPNDKFAPACSGDKSGNRMSSEVDDETNESAKDRLRKEFSAATEWELGLERTQRIVLGLDDEPMVFNETTVAHMLREVASDHDGLSKEFMVLHAIANALLGVDDFFKLKLTQKKRGKFKSPDVRQAEHDRRMTILHSVAYLEKQGWKTEAAIAQMQQRFGISRAAVFADIKSAEEFIKRGNEIFGPERFKNPRSNDFEY
ncbi:hypothetical protein [Sphingorhabdus contaminans]|uniref:hypothetical protein n=1 Tax=Sphingorhabdus contaminans TaxID=1343899 RepID=UPI003D2B1D64